jgi:methionine sulfoxide reductase heme-binding subunit
VSILASTLGQHGFWIASRAAGVAALLCSSAAVGVGLTMGGRLIKGRVGDLRVLHESLSLATIVALVVHAAALLGDAFLAPSVTDLTVPFASSYQRWWMAAGIIGGWMLIILGLSYYARARIGVQRWRSLHRFTALAWLLGLAHSLGQGTDAGTAWFLVCTGLVAVPALALLALRMGRADATAASRPSAAGR